MSTVRQARAETVGGESRTVARRTGLVYVTDEGAGISRQRAGRGWLFRNPAGQRITDAAERRRLLALAIPPAWTEVWICPNPRGHMQVTARDARGRKQYRYHPEYRAARERSKFRRILEFSDLLPRIRAQVERDLGAPSLSRTQLLATLVRLLDLTFIRIGNEEYARTNGSFGLTTLRDHHVQVRAGTLRFAFRGKSGVRRMVTLTDRRLARIIKRLQDLPGQELFQYLDEEGKPRSIGSDDVNAYLRKISGRRITAKDFRTWAGTVLAARALAEAGAASSVTEAKARVIVAIDHVARRLGNTRAVCRQFYIHPTIIESYHAGALVPLDTEGSADESGTLRADEVRVLQFLKSRGGTTGRSTTLGRERLRAS